MMKKNVVWLKNKVKRLVLKVFNTISYLLSGKNERLVVNAWTTVYREKPFHYNFGDELIFLYIKNDNFFQIV